MKGLAASLLWFLAGCSEATHEWIEETRLGDGTTINVERAIRFDYVDVPLGSTGSGWIADGEDLSFVDPLTGRSVSWSGHRRAAYYLDRVDGRYLIVAAQTRCGGGVRRGEPLWRAYELGSSGWRVVDVATVNRPITPNLVQGSISYAKTQEWSRVSIADKEAINAASLADPRLKVIDPADKAACL